jgi:hypothetical protein
MKKFVVKLTMYMDGYEKTSTHVVSAENEFDAQVIAMESECHNEPDYEDFPEKDGCTDDCFIYEPWKVTEITQEEFYILQRYL